MSSQNTFTAIRSMLLQSVDPTVFPAAVIKQGFVPAIGGNLITYYIIHSKRTSVTTVNVYDYDPSSQTGTRTNTILFENLIQVDFYSDTAYPANDAADLFYQYLTAIAPFYLEYNGFPDISIGIVEDVYNHTQPGDKGAYLYRYTVRFTLFTHQQITRDQEFIEEIQIIPYEIA